MSRSNVTAKQLAANRANALGSTGPRTRQGKGRSRWNALQHGILAQAVIPPALELYESRQALEQLLAVLRDEFAPGSAVEEMLVERIATSYWRLGRVLRAEAAAIAQRQENRQRDAAREDALDMFDPLAPAQTNALARQVQRLSAALSNRRSLRALMADENARWREAEDAEVQAARSIPELAEALQFARFETALERQFYRAFDALDRLQRLRAGEPVPPPLRVHLDSTVEPNGEAEPLSPAIAKRTHFPRPSCPVDTPNPAPHHV